MGKIDFYGKKPQKPYFVYQALMGLILAAIAGLLAFIIEYFK
jgi:hypothetical protein